MIIVVMEKVTFLIPMHDVICRVKVEDDFFRRDRMRRNELLNQLGIHVHRRLMVRIIFKATECRGTCQRLVVSNRCLQSVVVAEFTVIVEILFAATKGVDPLTEHLFEGVLCARCAPFIRNQLGGRTGQPQIRVRLLQ